MVRTMFAALALVSASAMAGDRVTDVSEQVAVDTAGGKVVVRLAIANRGTLPVYVPKAIYQDDELISPVFEIRDASTGKEVAYIGRKVKRGPITADDYLQVKPGARASNRIDITSSYDFSAGEHTYTLSFPGSVVHSLTRLDARQALPVMPVSFVLRK